MRVPSIALSIATFSVLGIFAASVMAEDTHVRAFLHKDHVKNHKKANCTSCHPGGAAADVERPSKSDHKSCDAKGCHAEEFFSEKVADTKVCFVCHVSKDWKDLEKGGENVRPFPRGRDRVQQNKDTDRMYLNDFDYYAEFSHKLHLADGGPVKEKAKDDSCLYCHQVSLEGDKPVVARPGHEHCSNCHNGSAAKPKTTMNDCNSCHQPRRDPETNEPAATGPRVRGGKLSVERKFSHQKHRLDRRKKEPTPTSCGVCHIGVEDAGKLGEIRTTMGQRTMTQVCKTCHDGRQRTANGRAIFDVASQCTACHEDNFLDVNVPKSHR